MDNLMSPNSPEGEEAVLGSILINPDALHEVSFLQSADFFLVRNMWIWDALQAIYARSHAIDTLTLVAELRSKEQLDQVGGLAYITQLVNHTPTHLNVATYARIVQAAAVRRRLMAAATEIAQLALAGDMETNELINAAEVLVRSVSKERGGELRSMREMSKDYYDTIEARQEDPDSAPGLPTGFREIDQKIGGLKPRKLIIIGGRPGMGKTAWMLNAAAAAIKARPRITVAVFSLEMGEEEIMDRLYSAETGIDSQKIQHGKLEGGEWDTFLQAVTELSDWNLYLDDSGTLDVLQIRRKCRRLQREVGLDLVIVDYLQLMTSEREEENRTQELSHITRNLKQMAQELAIPVIAGSQLSRAVEARQDKRPHLSDLRESGSLEQDADIVAFLYRDDYYNPNSLRPNQADYIIAKQRNGPTGSIPLFFKKENTRFTGIERAYTLNIDSGRYT